MSSYFPKTFLLCFLFLHIYLFLRYICIYILYIRSEKPKKTESRFNRYVILLIYLKQSYLVSLVLFGNEGTRMKRVTQSWSAVSTATEWMEIKCPGISIKGIIDIITHNILIFRVILAVQICKESTTIIAPSPPHVSK